MGEDEDLHGLIEQIYAAAMDPQRYADFVESWNSRVQNYLEDDDPLAQALGPHLVRATELIESSDRHEDESPSLFGFHHSSLAMAVDPSCRILDMTSAAEAAYGSLAERQIDELPLKAESISLLKRAILDCFSDGDEHVVPLYRAQTEQGLLATLTFVYDSTGNNTCVLIGTSEMAWHDDMNGIMSGPLGMTHSEIAVLRLFFDGHGVSEIAALRKISVHTVRTQMRSISAKTFTQTQGELVRLCAGLAAICRETETGVDFNRFLVDGKNMGGPFPQQNHCRFIVLPDDRRVEYSDFGPRDGIPFLMFHDDFFGDVWPAGLAQSVADMGVRIITPCRPGFGGTSAAPDGEKSYDIVRSDAEAVVKHLGLASIYGISRMTGMIYAVRTLTSLSVDVKGHLAVSPTLPYLDGVDLSQLPGHTRVLTRSVLQNKMALRFFTLTSRALDKRIGRARRLSIGYTSPQDKAYVSAPENEDVVARGARLLDGGGSLSWYNDLKDLGDDGGGKSLYPSIKFPLRVVVGQDDRTLRYERAIALQTAGIDLDVHQVEGAAELVFFTHPDSIIEEIRKMLSAMD